jgi:hypothetical protein
MSNKYYKPIVQVDQEKEDLIARLKLEIHLRLSKAD